MTTELETEIELPPANDAEEIQRLRKTKESLHQTAQTRKARIDELEATVATLTSQLESANKKIYDQTFALPLKAMSKDISVIPLLFEREFGARFGLVERDSVLYITKANDATPLENTNGELIPFTAASLNRLLENDAVVNAEDKDLFSRLLIGSRASGGGAMPSKRTGNYSPAPAKKPTSQPMANNFGIK